MSEVLGTPSVERQGFEPLLLLEGVTKSYDGWSKALDDVSLSVARGEFVSIIGCSGAGKSTLLRCVNRLIDPTQGSVVFDGDDVTHVRGRALRQTRRRIAMVFQHYNLVYRATAIENVLQGRLGYKSAVAGMLGLFSEDEKRRAFEILDQVGLADFAYARTDQLSGGQKQRVGIARALVQDPLLMLADEPIASLDPKSSRTVMEHLRWAADELGVACLANLHQVDFAMEFSDRIVALKKGRVVFDGAPHLLDEAAIADIYGTNEEAEAGSDFGERSVRQVGELSGSRTREADPERLGKAEAKDSSSPEVLQSAGFLSRLRGRRAAPRGAYDPSFFLRRTAAVVGMALVFVALGALSGTYVGFDFMQAILDVPGGLVWMATQFVPSLTSLQKLDTILPALGSTILASIASSCTAAVLAYICAVLGSRSVGVGGPFPLIVRAVASLFRNIPVVAWAFILLFSFKQSEFTGFFALFLTSFGYLTRCFLESIDEMSAGPVEALRASGATYGQIVAQAVVPMSITSVISWVMYMIETNIRDATLIGLLTGTGIGFVFDVYYKSFRYDIAGLVILSIVLVVIACELTSNFVRRKVI